MYRAVYQRPEPALYLHGELERQQDIEFPWSFAGTGEGAEAIDWEAFPVEPSQIRMVIDRALSPTEIMLASGCLGYALRATIAGEELSDPTTLWGEGFTTLDYGYDSTKSRRDDPDWAEAFEAAAIMVREGTPIRKTDRAGKGTAGTRLVEGIGDCEIVFYVR